MDKICTFNNWGRRHITISGHVLSKDITRLLIQWPDGSVTEEALTWCLDTMTVLDHGKPDRSTSLIPYIDFKRGCTTTRVSLFDLAAKNELKGELVWHQT